MRTLLHRGHRWEMEKGGKFQETRGGAAKGHTRNLTKGPGRGGGVLWVATSLPRAGWNGAVVVEELLMGVIRERWWEREKKKS